MKKLITFKAFLITLPMATAFVTLNSSPAHAWPWRYWCDDYVYTQSSMTGQNINSIVSRCSEVPLQLQRMNTEDGSLTVDGWYGGYKLVANITTTYEIDSYDSCSGAFLGSRNERDTSDQTLMFNIYNPNLQSGQPSFVSNAPLTDSEARAELQTAAAQCRSVQPGPWNQ